MPSLDSFSTENPEFRDFAINLEKPNQKKTRKFFKELSIENLEIYFDPEFKLTKKLKLREFPPQFLLNKNGNEFAGLIGEVDFYDKKFIKWLRKFV